MALPSMAIANALGHVTISCEQTDASLRFTHVFDFVGQHGHSD
jgi:hypothetical protein